MADPNLLEEGVAEAEMTIALNAYKELCTLHLGGKACLSPEVILNIASRAANRASYVIQMIKTVVEEDNNKRFDLSLQAIEKNILF